MRVLLVFSLLITLVVSIEQNAAPPVAQAATIVSISAGGRHTCAVKSDGTLACWGNNEHERATPPAGTFTQVSAGRNHTCGLKSDGTGVCWAGTATGKQRCRTVPSATALNVAPQA